MQFSIPLLKSATSSSSTSFDAAYQAFSGKMLLLNVPAAFNYGTPTKTSQGKWGVGDIGEKHAQNNTWNSQYAVATVAGSTALEVYAKTFSFSSNVSRIEAGRIKVGAYLDNSFHSAYLGGPNVIFNYNEATDRITNVKSMAAFPPIADKRSQKSYVATTPNGTKYLIVGAEGSIRSFALGATNYDVGSATANGTYNFTSFPATPAFYWLNFANVIAVKGQYVWVTCVDTGIDAMTSGIHNATASGLVRGYLFSLDNTGAFTLIDSAATIFAQLSQSTTGLSGTAVSVGRYYASGSYVKNNTAYCYADFYVWFRDVYLASYPKGTVSVQQYFTVNLSNVSAFTFTDVNKRIINEGGNNGTTNTAAWNISTGEVPVGFFSASSYLYFITSTGAIWYNTGAGFNNPSLVSAAGANDNMLRYHSTPTLMSTAASNISFNNAKTGLLLNNVAITGAITNSGTGSIWVYEMTGTNQEDDAGAFKGMMLNATAIQGYSAITENVSLYANNTLLETQTHTYAAAYAGAINTAIPTFTQGNRSFATVTAANPINATDIEFKATCTNSALMGMKLGFGLTSGTYLSPTGTNGAYGNSTSGWMVDTNGSYVDLILG